jgi:integrase
VTSVNRQLEVLRRILKLAEEWNETEKRLPRVEMLRGERHRDRVLSRDEEDRYLAGAVAVGVQIQDAYLRALGGIRARLRGKQPIEPKDPFLLRDVATLLIDCALRPEESFRLRWEYVRDGALNIPFGKTENARRTIPLSERAARLMEARRASAKSDWGFPAPTKSEHIEKSTLKKPHSKAYTIGNVASFLLYTFRHTCLTRWAAHMDPYTLGYLAGHSDFSTTKRYIHPQAQTVLAAMERARAAQGGHKTAHSADSDRSSQVA